MEEWKEYKLGEVVRLINGRAYSQHELFDDGKYRIVRVGNLSGGDRWFYSNMELSDEKYCEKGDLLYAWACNFGPYIWKGEKTIYHYHIWKLVEDEDVVDKLFLFHYLKYLTPYWLGNVNGSVMVHITKGTMEKFPITLPSLRTQRRIASILSSLDDKIEVNRRINDNLEAQAQALFKSWFVDFEPFRDGEFVESELGMIPKGWRVGSLSDIASINPTRSIKKGDKATYLDMKNMPTSGPFPLLCETKEYTGGMRFQNQDTLMARITPCLENGKVAYVNFLEEKEIAFGSTEYIVMTTKDGFLPELLYFLCRDEFFKGYATKNMNGSSGRQRVSGETIGNYKIPLPPKSLLEPIAPYFKSVMDTIRNNGFESRRLAALRDTLLPRLMSGDLKVNG